MIELVSRILRSGDINISLARHYLRENEWGMALKALEKGLREGNISDPQEALGLLAQIKQRLDVQH